MSDTRQCLLPSRASASPSGTAGPSVALAGRHRGFHSTGVGHAAHRVSAFIDPCLALPAGVGVRCLLAPVRRCRIPHKHLGCRLLSQRRCAWRWLISHRDIGPPPFELIYRNAAARGSRKSGSDAEQNTARRRRSGRAAPAGTCDECLARDGLGGRRWTRSSY